VTNLAKGWVAAGRKKYIFAETPVGKAIVGRDVAQ
jgi:hypothetical protein